MVLAQVGSWTNNAVFTFVGVLVGSLLYGLLAPYIVQLTKPRTPLQNHVVHDTLKVRYLVLALPMALLLTLVVVLLEVFIPWKHDLPYENRQWNGNIFQWRSWPPYSGGILIGVLQVVIVLAVGDTLGGSSSYVTMVSQWVVTKPLQEKLPYLARARWGVGNWWQVIYVVAAVLGSLVSSVASQSLAKTKGPSIPPAIFGGILMAFGARFAAGCTSGHGLSGMGLLAWLSFIAVPFMFAGGIGTGFAMQASGALDDYHCHSAVNYTAYGAICKSTLGY